MSFGSMLYFLHLWTEGEYFTSLTSLACSDLSQRRVFVLWLRSTLTSTQLRRLNWPSQKVSTNLCAKSQEQYFHIFWSYFSIPFSIESFPLYMIGFQLFNISFQSSAISFFFINVSFLLCNISISLSEDCFL